MSNFIIFGQRFPWSCPNMMKMSPTGSTLHLCCVVPNSTRFGSNVLNSTGRTLHPINRTDRSQTRTFDLRPIPRSSKRSPFGRSIFKRVTSLLCFFFQENPCHIQTGLPPAEQPSALPKSAARLRRSVCSVVVPCGLVQIIRCSQNSKPLNSLCS